MEFNDDPIDVLNKITSYFVYHKINTIFMWYIKSINNHPDFDYLTKNDNCKDFDYKFFKKTNKNYFLKKNQKKLNKKIKKIKLNDFGIQTEFHAKSNCKISHKSKIYTNENVYVEDEDIKKMNYIQKTKKKKLLLQ